MYEVDFTGWTRTPEAIEELKNSSWKRRKFHLKRVIKTIKYKRWNNFKFTFFQFLTNSKIL